MDEASSTKQKSLFIGGPFEVIWQSPVFVPAPLVKKAPFPTSWEPGVWEFCGVFTDLEV